jgi:hypothetical protein
MAEAGLPGQARLCLVQESPLTRLRRGLPGTTNSCCEYAFQRRLSVGQPGRSRDRGGPAQPGGLGVPLEARAPTMGPYDQPQGYPLDGNDVHERWVGTRARLRGRHSGSEVVSNVTVSQGHTVAKMLAVADAESFHARPGIRLVLAVKGRPRVATAITTPLFDPQDRRLRA